MANGPVKSAGTRPGGAGEQSSYGVQSGSLTHRMIASFRPDTTVLLFFFCSLQEATTNRPWKRPSIDSHAVEPGGFVSTGFGS